MCSLAHYASSTPLLRSTSLGPAQHQYPAILYSPYPCSWSYIISCCSCSCCPSRCWLASRNSHSAGARMQAKAAAASARQNWSRRPEAGQPLAAKARPCHTGDDRDTQGLCRPCVSIQGTEGLQWCPQPICRLTGEQLQLPCNCMAGGGWALGWGLIFPLCL